MSCFYFPFLYNILQMYELSNSLAWYNGFNFHVHTPAKLLILMERNWKTETDGGLKWKEA